MKSNKSLKLKRIDIDRTTINDMLDSEQSPNDILDGSSDDPSFSESAVDSCNDIENQDEQKGVASPGGNIAVNETVAVKRLKLLVLTALLLPTIAIACAVYFYTSNAEQKEFEKQFLDDGAKVLDSLGDNLSVMIESTEALAVALVSYAHNTNMIWPFVTLPDFYIRTSIIRSLSETVLVSLYPLVTEENREKWELYTKNNNYWVNESIRVQEKDKTFNGPIIYDYETWDVIHDNSEYEKNEPGIEGTNRSNVYFPQWQASPQIPIYPPYNWDLASIQDTSFLFENAISNRAVISPPYLGGIYKNPNDVIEIEEIEYEIDWFADYISAEEDPDEPAADFLYPIITEQDGSNIIDGNYDPSINHSAVGLLSTTYYWRDMLQNILPVGSNGIVVVIDTCLASFTYMIDGSNTTYLGPRDYHEGKYDYLEISAKLVDTLETSFTHVPLAEEYCPHRVRIYPSDDFRSAYASSDPIVLTIIVVLSFALLHTCVFLIYDKLVQKRNKLVMNEATRSRAIVNSLFPEKVVDLLLEGSDHSRTARDHNRNFAFTTSKKRLTSYLVNEEDESEKINDKSKLSKPIAEVFTDTTVMISDICGFSVWASVREPSQVFALLESIYGAFDAIIDRRRGGVFKVETIGDSYVAVSGLPERRKNHAAIMTKFAANCRNAFIGTTRDLEVTLGPETSDLSMRFGLSSGSLTAGVLRGKNARFQIFGNTVNMASRMESTGKGNMIHISKKTADLLIATGKENWLIMREERIDVKSFGTMQTYFVEPKRSSTTSASTSVTSGIVQGYEVDDYISPAMILRRQTRSDAKHERLVDWMVDLFSGLLKNILSHRPMHMRTSRKSYVIDRKNENRKASMVRDEVVEIIHLPEFNPLSVVAGCAAYDNAVEKVDLGSEVLSQLRCYINQIALRYNNNAFHNFEHACQVTMATKKIFNRVVTPDDIAIEGEKDLHDSTYGITSDPLTQFAVVFSALIHDVNHPGVPNNQLVVENTPVAIQYKNLSVSEQHSIDIAWNLLMNEDAYPHLRSCIFSSPTELQRFRQLVVNAVMATDIFDKELKAIRDARWDKAFEETNETTKAPSAKGLESLTGSYYRPARIFSNRRATIVIEHIIQASDIAHCMQHWKVYQKWNKRLFQEVNAAYIAGRKTPNKDPAESWYGDELWFFDNYIIPLAKKLKECGVFGVSCDEFLDYACDNRQEWATKGREIVEDMVTEARENAKGVEVKNRE